MKSGSDTAVAHPDATEAQSVGDDIDHAIEDDKISKKFKIFIFSKLLQFIHPRYVIVSHNYNKSRKYSFLTVWNLFPSLIASYESWRFFRNSS